MNRKRFVLFGVVGCGVLVLLLVALVLALLVYRLQFRQTATVESPTAVVVPGAQETQSAIPTLTVPPAAVVAQASVDDLPGFESGALTALYEQVNPGVVNIQVYVERDGMTGQGAGSGFILDGEGRIITNNHVVEGARLVTVIFYNGVEARAEIIGTDDDSDLAVIQVETLAEGAHPLPMGDSDQVQVGEWVVAIGNPFRLGGSVSLGIVSATGRSIPSGVERFVIPEAIQTDAAINPGNSGGPLLNLDGEVVGVNAQIASGGAAANAGVGFAIPANIVRRVAPVLIANGSYRWPWLGVEGGSVNLAIAEANDLPSQEGAYISGVVEGGPAARGGLRGTSDVAQVDGLNVPVGGDVVVEADGERIAEFADLLVIIASGNPGDELTLTVLRDGERQEIAVTLDSRP